MGDTFSLKITDKVLYIQYLDRSRYDSTDFLGLCRPQIIANTPNTRQYKVHAITAAPLTVRGMKWDPLPETVCRMDAASERTGTYLQRVSGDGSQFMSRMV